MPADWQEFFTTLAQVSVTVFSIMFLAMQVRSQVWRRNRLFSVEAYSALVELFVPMLAAMVTLMAGHPWPFAAGLAGSLGLAMVVVHWLVYLKWPAGPAEADGSGEEAMPDQERRFHRLQLRGSMISIIIYGAILLSAFDPWTWGLHLMAAASVWLLFSGSFEAWWLLEPKALTPNHRDQ